MTNDDPRLPGTDDSARKYLPISQFRGLGFLQEVNRLVLHPCGLAMELVMPEDESITETKVRIWDYRDDPEGIVYDSSALDGVAVVRADRVAQIRRRHHNARVALFDGKYTRDEPVDVQPLPDLSS